MDGVFFVAFVPSWSSCLIDASDYPDPVRL
jgi:hypothetical protein